MWARPWHQVSEIESQAQSLARLGKPVFDLAEAVPRQAEMPLVTLPRELAQYPDVRGFVELRRSISVRERTKYSLDVGPENVIITHGATEGIFLAMYLLLRPGDSVLIQAPALSLYRDIAENLGAQALPFESSAGGIFPPSGSSADIRMCILHSPSNPRGDRADEDFLARVVKWAAEDGRFTLIDQVYDELIYDTTRVEERTLDMGSGGVIKVNSFSKSFGLPGLRLGWIVARPGIVTALAGLAERLRAGVSPLIQRVATDLASRPVDLLVDSMARRRRMVAKWLEGSASSWLTSRAPAGGVSYWLQIQVPRMSARWLCKEALEKKGVWMMPGSAFWGGDDGHLRLSFGNEEHQLMTGLHQLEALLHDLNDWEG